METLEELILKFEKEKDNYSASFDPETGKVISVGPSVSFKDEKNKIDLDKEIAEDIIASKILINSCFVDAISGKLEIVESKSIVKIDDVLHRVTLSSYCDAIEPDLYITYNRNKKQIVFELSENVGGSRKTNNFKKRNIHWNSDTILYFYLTRYNDPHWIYASFSFSLSELYKNNKIFEDVTAPKKFSIFTKRILKNYVIEIT
jgi:hypothetical protein